MRSSVQERACSGVRAVRSGVHAVACMQGRACSGVHAVVRMQWCACGGAHAVACMQ